MDDEHGTSERRRRSVRVTEVCPPYLAPLHVASPLDILEGSSGGFSTELRDVVEPSILTKSAVVGRANLLVGAVAKILTKGACHELTPRDPQPLRLLRSSPEDIVR